MTPRRREQLGDRIRRYRRQKELSLSELADRAGISKGYISNLERNSETTRPSANTLFAIAKALGVTMADLHGHEPVVTAAEGIPKSLREFAEAENLPESDIRMLAAIEFRGERPRTKERWRYIYDAIRVSREFDRP